METPTPLLSLAALIAGLTFGSQNALAGETPLETAPVRFVIDPPKRGLGLEGAAFGAAFGGLLVGVPTVIGGGDSGAFQLTLVSAGLGALAGGLAGTMQPRGRGPTSLQVGDDLRLASDAAIRGTFEGATDEGVVLRLPNGEERVISYRDALEVRRSTRLTGVGAVVGGTVTLAGVLLIHAVLCEGECSDGPSGIAYAFVGGGVIAGAGLGALVRSHDWRHVKRETPEAEDASPRRQVAFKVAPARGKGVSGQVSIRWR